MSQFEFYLHNQTGKIKRLKERMQETKKETNDCKRKFELNCDHDISVVVEWFGYYD